MTPLNGLILVVGVLLVPQIPASQNAPTGEWPPNGVLRPGAGITAPVLLHETKPNYTPEAMRARIQGLIELECIVEVDGLVGPVRVTRSLDTVYGLDQRATDTLRRWRFRPGTKDGAPVPVVVTVQMSFTLGPMNGAAPGVTPPSPLPFNGDAPVPLGWPDAFGTGSRVEAADPTVIASATRMVDAFPQSLLDVRFSYSHTWSVMQSGNGVTLYSDDSKGTRSLTISPPRPATFTLDQPLSRQALDGFTLAAGLGPSFLNNPRLVQSGQVARAGGLWIWFEIAAPSFASWNAPPQLADRLRSGYGGIHIWSLATTAAGQTISAFCTVVHRAELSDAEKEDEVRRAGAEFGEVLRSVVIYQR